VRAQLFDGSGSKSGSELLVNASATSGYRLEPAVVGLSGGGFVVTFDNGIVIAKDVFTNTGVRDGNETAIQHVQGYDEAFTAKLGSIGSGFEAIY
jgi:hypothetical protein